ncbi:Elongation factor P-like protein [hydrothermal vent metagenome]|uniref:Elongation factor P-like protein n=1 Tax=hydrothermal vent metagenome TaxID=652676 RepID=A0A3B0Z7H8_9ZZZZ
MKANELKKGMVISVDGQNIYIKQVIVQSPSSRSGNTLYKCRGQNVLTRIKFERNFKGDDVVSIVEFFRRPVQLLFRDTEGCTFMDGESYEQFTVPDILVEDELPYIGDDLEGLFALIAEDMIIGIELPATVTLDIIECAPGIKGASASARTKPATMSTGLVIQVPEYLEAGETIKINTSTNEYMSRA